MGMDWTLPAEKESPETEWEWIGHFQQRRKALRLSGKGSDTSSSAETLWGWVGMDWTLPAEKESSKAGQEGMGHSSLGRAALLTPNFLSPSQSQHAHPALGAVAVPGSVNRC